jgi:hypothetical protein
MSGQASGVPISIVGLPSSGKTTFLAALWHLVQTEEVATRLRFGSLSNDDFAYLNLIVKRWRSATEQARTQTTGIKSVSMNLLNDSDRAVRITFPDVPGEEYRRMWEDREVDKDLARTLSSGNILLLLNGNKIKAPAWVTERAEIGEAIGIPLPKVEPETWHPKGSPTQVQLVDLLQHLTLPPLEAGPRRLVVMVSAWDKAEGEGLKPEPFIRAKLPLLGQYLQSARDGWDWRVYGVSAQGGEYDQDNKVASQSKPEAVRLRELNRPSERIKLVFGETVSHDLTEPLEWLMKTAQ